MRALPLMLGWLLVVLLALAGPAQAQPAETDGQTANATLANLLENEETRQQLIEQLRGMAAEPATQEAAPVSLPRQLAEITSRVASDIGGQLGNAVDVLRTMGSGDLDSTFDMEAFTSATINLGLVILATLVLFLAFRRIAKPLFTSISQWSLNGEGLTPVLRLIICVALAALVDVLIVALAYLGGNLLATFAIGETGELSTRASLFLNAFLVIELIKAGVRMLFASRYEGLRLLPITSTEAAYWNRWLKTIAAVVVGLQLSSFLSQTIGRRITLSDDLRRKLPMLEARLNSYVPNALRVIRTVILVLVAMLVLNAWGAFDLAAWYASESGSHLVGKLISVAVILMFAIGVWLALASLIEHKLNPETGSGTPSARAMTLLTLFRNALAIALVTITLMIVLAEIGINIGPLIAGAGVLGLAIGFGAQKLVQDIITGVFIQVENAMNTGDVVTVAGITGTAERLSIRSVGIRDLNGTYHIVPFSSVDTVSNYMREFGYHVGEYGIAYRESIDDAVVALREAFDELAGDEEHKMNILAPLEVAGVVALADSSVNIRVRIKTTPGTQWSTGRAFNRLVKLHFDAKGIEIPFPHTTLYFGVGKEGEAPPGNLRVMQQPFDIDGRPGGQPRSGESSRAGEEDPRSSPNPEFKGDFDED
ncbi:MAG: mechanosensitive ion channel [Halomonas sp.]|nr:mechanosensitive ion channel [Halomonas sp.]